MPKLPDKKISATSNPPKPSAPPAQSISLASERERVRKLLEAADSMTPEQYLARQKTDPTLVAPNVDVRRSRLGRRLTQLEHMTQEQWEAEQRAGIVLAPSPSTRAVEQTPLPASPPPIKP